MSAPHRSRLDLLRLEAAKWAQTIQISLSNHMAYKLHFVLLVIGPSLVFFFVRYNLWTSIYAVHGVQKIGSYDLHGMLRYQVWVMIVAFLAQSYYATNLAEDIRLGRISSYLIYPFEFWQYHTADFVALEGIQILVALVTAAVAMIAGWSDSIGMRQLVAGTTLSLMAGVFWFAVNFSLGLIAFWLEETWVLRVMFVTVSTFLSGAVLPLDVYPAWLRTVLGYTPFPYVTFVPVKVFLGEYGGNTLTAILTVFAWTLVAALLARTIWRRGLKLYTAAGM